MGYYFRIVECEACLQKYFVRIYFYSMDRKMLYFDLGVDHWMKDQFVSSPIWGRNLLYKKNYGML